MATYSNPDLFLEISCLLTGFSEAELTATGMLDCYYNTVLVNCNETDVTYFFQNVKDILTAPKRTEESTEQAIAAQLIPEWNYSGLAQSIIMLWYTGNWNNSVVVADSYIQGLMWNAGHTHPPGAKQPGYGSWAIPPFSVK